jgi:hypothetical protein
MGVKKKAVSSSNEGFGEQKELRGFIQSRRRNIKRQTGNVLNYFASSIEVGKVKTFDGSMAFLMVWSLL